jgi:AraC-like DNA-binding protein
MTHPALLPASTMRPVLDYVDRLGVPRSPRMERIAARLGDPSLLLPYTVAGHVFEDAVLAGAGEDVGLRAGEAARLERIGAFGERLRRAPTVAAGIDLAVRQRHNSGQRYALQRRGSEAWLQRRVAPCVRHGRAEERDFSLEIALHFFRLAAGPHWRPLELHVEGPAPAYAEELAALATRRVQFDAPHTVIVFSASLLSLPLPRPDGESLGPPPLVAPADFDGSLRATVRSLLQLGELALATAAEAAGTSPRSLQRHLAAAGLGFAELVDDVRFELALRLLRDPHAKVVEIAAELGYTDSANFTRAFRRWAGVSPRGFRRGLSEQPLAS